jgi:hypothetical protein
MDSGTYPLNLFTQNRCCSAWASARHRHAARRGQHHRNTLSIAARWLAAAAALLVMEVNNVQSRTRF